MQPIIYEPLLKWVFDPSKYLMIDLKEMVSLRLVCKDFCSYYDKEEKGIYLDYNCYYLNADLVNRFTLTQLRHMIKFVVIADPKSLGTLRTCCKDSDLNAPLKI